MCFSSKRATEDLDDFNDIDNDPFDTAFAENILPGKAELKLLENEILNANEENAFRPEDKLKQILNSKVSIHLTNPGGERESISSLDRIAGKCLYYDIQHFNLHSSFSR